MLLVPEKMLTYTDVTFHVIDFSINPNPPQLLKLFHIQQILDTVILFTE